MGADATASPSVPERRGSPRETALDRLPGLGADCFCTECDHTCRVTLIACADPEALAIARELVRTNVDFHAFEAATLGA